MAAYDKHNLKNCSMYSPCGIDEANISMVYNMKVSGTISKPVHGCGAPELDLQHARIAHLPPAADNRYTRVITCD